MITHWTPCRAHLRRLPTQARPLSTSARVLREASGRPYSDLIVGSPRETYPGERRIALTPANVTQLLKKGFKQVLVAQNAGVEASFPDEAYRSVGASVVPQEDVFARSDILLKVRPPELSLDVASELQHYKENATLISFLYPSINPKIIQAMQERNLTAFAMDQIPRISRAQVFDALSSMANIAGYKAILEASNVYGRYLCGQVTAAGKVPPSRVLVIGAGVAGLSAISTARRSGAIVRGFDTRAAVAEQIESLGAEFLTVDVKESGEGGGGYAKEMSKEFIEAEMALFLAQAKEVDIIVTTALIPGRTAPKLITEEMIKAMKPGSVVVDLAAEAGGNCVLTEAGKMVTKHGVSIIGYTDLPSRLPTQASTLYSNNVTKFLLSIGKESQFKIDLEDEVIRKSIVLQNGNMLWPAPQAPQAAVKPSVATPPAHMIKEEVKAVSPWQKVSREVSTVSVGLGTTVALGASTSAPFMGSLSTFSLASLIGYSAVWNVTPALHSPLMALTNALSGLVGVAGMFLLGGSWVPHTIPQSLAAAAVFMANVNIFGGFIVTKSMLDLFRRPTDPPEYSYLWAIPAAVFGTGFLVAMSASTAGLVQAGYLASSLLCIGGLTGLASQVTARSGNMLGMLGTGIGVASTLAATGYSPEVLGQFGLITMAGALVGSVIGRRVTAIQLPQCVAALHSVVGLAAILTSIASVMADLSHFTTLHGICAYLGIFVGGLTFTGSIVAFLKLAGRMGSRPIVLPGRRLVEAGLLSVNASTMAYFLSAGAASPGIAAGCLLANATLSCIQGITTTCAVGSADTPVVITVLNAYSGLALAAEGLMLDNFLLTAVGSLIASSGSILSHIMCKAMNRSIFNVLFGSIPSSTSSSSSATAVGDITKTSVDETVEELLQASKVIIVPGYGMAVAKAQHALAQLALGLKGKGVNVRFGVHPVAGRMPGQINVLLAEASVPYEDVFEMDEINDEFTGTDVTLVIGCNDTVNPIALEEGSPISGMPVIQCWKSERVIVMKRGMASGYAEVPNPLFGYSNSRMLFGDALATLEAINASMKSP